MKRILLTSFVLAFFCRGAFSQPKIYNILSYGARPVKSFKNTNAIQNAIDAACAAGGGTVLIPDGYFTTGPIVLKSGVELHLDDDAVLLGSTNRLDYNAGNARALISAIDQEKISITGHGIINGQGRELVENVLDLLSKGTITDPQWKTKRPGEKNRPPVISFYNCRHIKLKGFTLKDASGWVQGYDHCNDLAVDSITVQSTAYWNNDGIDITDCKNVSIRNSIFNAADDAICLKSEDVNAFCENITVENCTLRSSASGFKLGTGSRGGFKHIRVNNLLVYNTYRSAIALETVDGAILEDVDIRNVIAKNTGNAIFLRLGHRNNDERYSTLKHIYIGNVLAEIPAGKPDIGYPVEGPAPKVAPHNIVPASITGIPGHPVEDVVLENIELTYAGKADKNLAEINLNNLDTVTENIAGYPEFTMFGELPSWGLYLRHVKNITLKNIKLSATGNDFRPACVFDDVDEVTINQLQIPVGLKLPAIVNHHVTRFASVGLSIPGEMGQVTIEK